MNKNIDLKAIPADMFEFCNKDDMLHDKKLDTKPVGYFQDAFRRFCKNKSSVAGAIIIFAIILFAIFVPIFSENNYTRSTTDTMYLQYTKLLPKSWAFSFLGWDGCTDETISEGDFIKRKAIAIETGYDPVAEQYTGAYEAVAGSGNYVLDVKTDTYLLNGMIYLTLTEDEYKDLQNWQNEYGVQVIYPAVDTSSLKVATLKNDANIWYQCTNKGLPKLSDDGRLKDIYKKKGSDGDYNSLRIASDDGSYKYAIVGGTSEAKSYTVRVFTYTYFQYRYGFVPCFLFGTNAYGQDIFTRLAKAARFSLVFAVCVASINMFLGTIYGSIEGYYGGWTDIIMERISDILSAVPFVVVTNLFQLYLAKKCGTIVAFLLAYVSTGWIGMASSVRMQFYRFKNQEYILAARTLGAKDSRLMFKHIFPNSLGTLVTRCALIIPGVISSESTMTYLGIVNLDSPTTSSIGTMLSAGKAVMSTYPHIIFFPALIISLLMISFNLFGNGLRDAFNPSLRGTED